MGVNTQEGSNVSFWYIFKGELRQKVDEGEATDDEGSILKTYTKRKNKKDVLIYERRASGGIDGKIVALEWAQGNFGKEIKITLEDEGEKFVITIQALTQKKTFGNYAGSFCDQLPLLDFKKPVKIYPYEGVKYGDKTYTGISLSQPDEVGKFVKLKGDKDNYPEQRKRFEDVLSKKPDAEEVEGVDGKEWDFSKPSKWQKKQLANAITRLTELLSSGESPKSDDEEDDIEDDLPF